MMSCGANALAQSPSIPSVEETGPRLAAAVTGTFTQPPDRVPNDKMADGPVLGNGDLGVVIGGKADQLTFHLGKDDFFGVLQGGMVAVGSVNLTIPELKDANAYEMEQHVGPAQITGTFAAPDGAKLSLTSWVASADNLLLVTLKNEGTKPLTISSALRDGLGTPGNAATRATNADTTSLLVSPDIVDVELGNRLHGLGNEKPGTGDKAESAFTGEIAYFRLYDRAFVDHGFDGLNAEPPVLLRWPFGPDAKAAGTVQISSDNPDGSALFTGNPADDLWLGTLLVPQRQWSVVVKIKPTALAPGITSVVSACLHQNSSNAHGLRLALVNGKPSVTLNSTTIAAANAVHLNEWTQLVAYYDGESMTLVVDGKQVATTKAFPTADQVMGAEVGSIHFGDSAVPYDGCSPQGLMIQRVVPGANVDVKSDVDGLHLTLPPGAQATLAVAVVTNRNDPAFDAFATKLVTQLDAGKLAALADQHARFWHEFWTKSFVEIPDQSIQDNWYASLYLLACCSRAGCPPPGLWGNFVTAPVMAWDGDYTLNYNFQAPFWGAYASNHMELTDSYEAPLLDYMPRGRAIAAKFHQQGLYYYMHIIPAPGWSNGGHTTEGQKCATLFSSLNCVMRWRYTRDLDYAKKVYPLLKGTADFWDNALTLQDGHYVDLKDCAAEGKDADTPSTTLAFLRQFYTAMIELSALLHVDADRVPHWRDILAKLTPLPIVPAASVDHLETSLDPHAPRPPPGQRAVNNPAITLQHLLGPDLVRDRLVIRNAVAGYGFAFPQVQRYKDGNQRTSGPGMSSCQCIYPGWAIGLESSAVERKAALDTITLSAQWYDFNNQCSFYPGAACAGYDPAEILANLHTLIARDAYPNFIIHAGGGGTENFAVTPAALAAMFVQSYQANIHLFPDWPRDQNAAFGQLNACGGFLISSAIHGGTVNYVVVKSLAGEDCHLANPWPGHAVALTSSTAPAQTLTGDVLVFKTAPGEEVRLTSK
jgi:hypothetical protein